MRFLLAFAGGTLITLAMLVIGLSFFDDPPNKASLRKGVEVAPLPAHHTVDIADWVRETRGDLAEPVDGEPVVRLPAPPPVVFQRADIEGFVQVRFTVLPDGTASDVRVFGAVPAGYYERQAVEQVLARRWEPGVDDDGNRVRREATEVVRFTLPADTPRRVDP